MIEINLREFYPDCYKSDYFVEVPDEVAELLRLLKREISPNGEESGEIAFFGKAINEISPEKIGFVADYEGRSVNSHILVLVRENIRAFEQAHGPIARPLQPDQNVKPGKK